MSNASVSVYKRPWKLFTDWSASYLGDMPINLPLQPAILALFIAHLYSRSYSSSSVTTYISAISYVHKLAGVADPTETPLIIQILKGYRKLTPVNDVRLPITLPVLRNLIRAFEHSLSSHYQSRLMCAMPCVLWHFSLFSALGS